VAFVCPWVKLPVWLEEIESTARFVLTFVESEADKVIDPPPETVTTLPPPGNVGPTSTVTVMGG
jgi:hypothetical protein